MIISNIKGLVGTWSAGTERVFGSVMGQLPIVEDAYIRTKGGLIAEFGKMSDYPYQRADYDAAGRYVMPAFCDGHTHLIYAAARDTEWVDRLQGLSYEQIAQRGGGILNSVDKLRNTSEDQLFSDAFERVKEIMATGTGAVEIKSGYGLDLQNEIKMLRVAARLREALPITIRPTLLAAHAVAREYKGQQSEYVDMIIRDIIPAVAAEGLADFIDVFCDRGFFTTDETSKMLDAAAKFGIRGKIHANELAPSGGVEVACAKGCLSADHLEEMDEKAFAAFVSARNVTIPTALPAASFFLGIPYAPVREMIKRDLAVAIASDFNPGSAPSGNMQLVGTLACTQAKMLPKEAITASTINGAAALGLGRTHGSIEVGKVANLIITKPMHTIDYLYYNFGQNNVERLVTVKD